MDMIDITKIDIKKLLDFDLLTHSFPCTNISVGGNQAGAFRNSGTASSLVWNVVDIIEIKKPKIIIFENVKNLVSKKFKPILDDYITCLDKLGYTTSYKVLVGTDFGVPQRRERIFCVSILGNKPFKFPIGSSTNKVLADIMEDNVESKYYLGKDRVERFKASVEAGIFKKGSLAIGTTQEVSNFLKGSCSSNQWVYSADNVAPTLTRCMYKQPLQVAINGGGILRKLTPKECWRLMGFDDEEVDKLKDFSDTSLYKMAGNSVVVSILQAIFREMENQGILTP